MSTLATLPPPPVESTETAGTTVRPSKYAVYPCRADLMPQGEVILPGIWKRLHDEKIFGMFFHDRPDITFGQFVNALSVLTEKVEVICELDDDGVIVDSAALTILTQIMVTPLIKRAIGNFLLFRKYWNGDDSIDIGRIGLRHWFTDFGLDIIVGTTPKLNRAALAYVHRLGFTSIGEIPDFASYKGQKCPTIISHLTKAEWERLNG